MSVKAEVSFLVYHNGIGRIEDRTMELSDQDYTACSSSDRNDNEQLKSWAKMMFPTAEDVKIQYVTQLFE